MPVGDPQAEKTALGQYLDPVSLAYVRAALPQGGTEVPPALVPHLLDLLYTIDRGLHAVALTSGLTVACRADETWPSTHWRILTLADVTTAVAPDLAAVPHASDYQNLHGHVALQILDLDALLPDGYALVALLDQVLSCLQHTQDVAGPVRDDVAFVTAWTRVFALADAYPVAP